MPPSNPSLLPRQVTSAPHGHLLTNTAVWSPDSQWIVYDVRSDLTGAVFDGTRIERVNIATGEVEVLYESCHGACCGVPTYHPTQEQVVFILGPEHPTADWQYSFCHRQGVIVETDRPQVIHNLDARDLISPFTPGALRGGSHVHLFSPDGKYASFTYDDHIQNELGRNQRNVGIALVGKVVKVPHTHPRNHDGTAFSVVITRTVGEPQPGSDEICKAYEDAWLGNRRIAFLGDILSEQGEIVTELFVVDLPEDVTVAGLEPMTGTATAPPAPPLGTTQRRLTHTTKRKYPGIQGPRHWPRSSPDGKQIAFLMRDDAGHVQLWTICPSGGEPRQITHHNFDIASVFNWHPDGVHLAAIADGSIMLINSDSGESRRLTKPAFGEFSPRGEACVVSPDGRQVAYVQPVHRDGATYNQIFIAETGLG
jgi:hypothetical protein